MTILTRSCRAPTPDERRAAWAYRYAMGGHHRKPSKPRVRVKPRIRAFRIFLLLRGVRDE